MPKDIYINAGLELSGELTAGSTVTADGFVDTGPLKVEENTLTNTSNTAFLAAATYTLPNGSTLGTRKLIINDQGGVSDPGFFATNGPDVDNTVYAITHDTINNKLYFGGAFDGLSDGSVCNRIAVLDLSTNTVSNIMDVNNVNGVTSTIETLHYYNSNIYIGGNFTSLSNGASASRVAKYDIVNNVFVVPGGHSSYINNIVRGSTNIGSNVYIVGNFDGSSSERIVRWDTLTDVLYQVTDTNGVRGPNGSTWAVVAKNSNLYISGSFTNLDGVSTSPNTSLVKYDEKLNLFERVIDIGGTISAKSQTNALAVYGDEIFLGGTFRELNGTLNDSAINIAVYNEATGEYSNLNDGTYWGVYNYVRSFSIVNDKLYIFGNFDYLINTWPSPFGPSVDEYVVYDLTTRQFLPPGSGTIYPAFNTSVYASFVVNSSIYVGGQFISVGDTDILRIGRYDPSGSVITESTINGSFRKSDGTTPSSQTLANLGGTLDIVWDGTYWTVI